MGSVLCFLSIAFCLSFSSALLLPPDQQQSKTFRVNGHFNTCQELFENGHTESGIYPLRLHAGHKKKTWVYCNATADQSGTIILFRYYGKENFTRSFNEYRRGFGKTSRDYWVGLDPILQIVAAGHRVLTITMQDWANNTRYARYQNFWLDPYPTYALHISGFTGSVPEDDMAFQNGHTFATVDRVDPYGCAANMKAGWWFSYCAYTLLTGRYYFGGTYRPTGQFFDGMYWKDWFGHDISYNYSLKYVTMTLSPY